MMKIIYISGTYIYTEIKNNNKERTVQQCLNRGISK
jgi:hypothetical protein